MFRSIDALYGSGRTPKEVSSIGKTELLRLIGTSEIQVLPERTVDILLRSLRTLLPKGQNIYAE